MARAFSCDLCETLEHGDPLGKSTFEVTDPDSPTRQKLVEEWCIDCLASFSDWRDSRIPEHPDDEDEDAARD